MFNFFKNKLSNYHVIKYLESDDFETRCKGYDALNGNYGNTGDRHGNSSLTYALAWGKVKAARCLIIYFKSDGINYTDSFSSSRSTALILAAKINATSIVKLIIGHGSEQSINQQDHCGFTALHYACIYRNTSLIDFLICSGADVNIKNDFSKTPLDYYYNEISVDDLSYNYGRKISEIERLEEVYDYHKQTYQGTKTADYSALRWFLPHVIVSNGWGKDRQVPDIDNSKIICQFYHLRKNINDEQIGQSLYDWLNTHLEQYKPVVDGRLYEHMIEYFIQHRNLIETHKIGHKIEHRTESIL